jgi:hypothetical protein
MAARFVVRLFVRSRDDRLRMLVRALVWWVCMAGLLLGCGGGSSGTAVTPRDAGVDASIDAAVTPVATADPCLRSGLHFDGKSECDVVRCPELRCDCQAGTDAGVLVEALEFHACAPGQGCVDSVDCKVACSASARLERMACLTRLSSPGAACTSDVDCVTGHCRQESAGKYCVDMLACGVDGHCSAGHSCRQPAGTVDDDGAPGVATSLGSCSDGSYGAACYEDSQCKYRLCSGQTCAGGRTSDPCKADDHCASGFCRLAEGTSTGSCVSGERGASCLDDADCSSELHCTQGTCYSAAIGQTCDGPDDCQSKLCVTGVCRGGELGSVCLESTHCQSGICYGARCVSGGLLSPCAVSADCRNELRCARSVCSNGAAGSPCSTASDCDVRACVRGSCRAGVNGDICEAPEDCQSNRCANPAGVEPGECTSGASGSYCIGNSSCESGSCSPQGTCN